ncbi:hypothetical protein MHYP_G00087200 [Metynnis hypsauchen]
MMTLIWDESVIKTLCVYLSEDPADLLREYVAADEALIQGSTEETTLGVCLQTNRDASREPDISIVLEGQVVLQELDNADIPSCKNSFQGGLCITTFYILGYDIG